MMKKYVEKIALLLAVLWIFTGCTVQENPDNSTAGTTQGTQQEIPGTTGGSFVPDGSAGEPVRVDFEKNDAEMFDQLDLQDTWGSYVTVTLSGNSISSTSDSVRQSGKYVTVTGAAAYLISGSLDDGMLVVDAGKNDTVHLIFQNVSIHNATSAALYVKKAGKVIVTLAEGTKNTLSNGGSFQSVDESTIDGAVFSKKDLTFNGSGSLEVVSPVGHGIVCKDNLVMTGGSYTISCAGHGLDANDSIRIGKAELTIDAGQDGIHGETTDDTTLGYVYLSGSSITVEAEGDGISAGGWLQLQSGSYDLLCGGGSENGTKANSGGYGDFMGGGPGFPGGPGGPGGGRASDSTQTGNGTESTSMKGLKAAAGLVINGGTLKMDSADDAVHSDLSAVINGGIFTVASGDDAVHAEQILTITNCEMTVSECYEGLEAHEIYVTGGTVKLTSTDDGINAAGGNDDSGSGGRDQLFGPGGPGGPGGHGGNSDGVVAISGGYLYLNASGDGIDSNGKLAITGGYTVVCGPTRGDTAVLDYDTTATIDGGTFIGTGSVMMAQTLASNSGQGVVAAYSQGGFSAGTKITLTSQEGKQLISYTPELEFQLVIFSTPEMVSGAEYTLAAGEATTQLKAN